MNKRAIVGIIAAGLVLIGGIGGALGDTETSRQNIAPAVTPVPASNERPAEDTIPTCDGKDVTKNCTLDGIAYSTYIYHVAEPEKSHTETVTKYERKVSSYCTLCNDGTYSPSCATGRGACSHHGGVAQWNAPRYSNVPVYSTKKVVDVPAKKAYYEKVLLSD